jgi:hypothetical protein
VLSPCDSTIKNYTDIFHLSYKGNVPSFQCKMNPDWYTSVREVDGLNLILIDLYVPAFTPRLHCSEAALQLSENTSLLEFCCIYTRISSKEG